MSWWKKALAAVCVIIAVVAIVVLCCVGIGWLAGAGFIASTGWLATTASTIVGWATTGLGFIGLTCCASCVGYYALAALAISMVVGYLIAPEEMDEARQSLNNAIYRGTHSIGALVGGVVGAAVSGASSGFFGSEAGKWVIIAACAVGGYLLLRSTSDDRTVRIESNN